MTSQEPRRKRSTREAATRPFAELGLDRSLCATLSAAGYEQPTPIQREAIPHILEGRDLMGCAQTGTGKTAAFALPILQQMLDLPRRRRPTRPRALVLAPTRELAAQISASFSDYATATGLRAVVAFGGVGKTPQIDALRRGVDVLVATPGRLLDLMQMGAACLDEIAFFVLDEADRMLDMGFIHDVQRITRALPAQRQTLLFSATLPREVESLARDLLRRPTRVAVDPVASTCEPISQAVHFVDSLDKTALLIELLAQAEVDRALIFTRTRRRADRLERKLGRSGIRAAAIHGDKSQGARERALDDLKSGRTRVVVATDLAARGLDVVGLSHVFNFDLPNEPEAYVHRVGRTGRAGASGIAISFCSDDERPYLSSIEQLIQRRLERAEGRENADGGRPPQERSSRAVACENGQRASRPRPDRRDESRGGRGRKRRKRSGGEAGVPAEVARSSASESNPPGRRRRARPAVSRARSGQRGN